MIGLGADACTYNYDFGVHYDMALDYEYATTGDKLAGTCGYYVEIEWRGK